MSQRMTLQQFRELPPQSARGKKPRKNEESNHQQTFFSILRHSFGKYPFLAFIFSVPNGAHRDKKTRGLSQREGQRPGVPDVIFPFQRRGYPGAYMENKFGENTLTKPQIAFRDHLLSEGYCFKICYTVEQQIEFTNWYLGIDLNM